MSQTSPGPHAVDLGSWILVGWCSSAHNLVLMHLGLWCPTNQPTNQGARGKTSPTNQPTNHGLQGRINAEISLAHDLSKEARLLFYALQKH